MSMMKVFRKYNKHMLAIFVVGLLISWLLSDTLQQLGRGNPGTRVVGRAFDEKIMVDDLKASQASIDVLETLGAHNPMFSIRRMLATSERPSLDYLLLVREAQQMGIRVSAQSVDEKLEAAKVPVDAINYIMKQNHLSQGQFRDIVADVLSVYQAFILAVNVPAVSDADVKSVFTMTNDRMKAAILPVSASTFVGEVAAPTDKELESHFADYKDRFRFDNRIAVEYLEVDTDAIKSKIHISKLRAETYWEEHKSEFTETTTRPSTKPSTSSQPAEPEEVTRVLTFEEALPKIIAQETDRLTREKAAEVISTIRDRAASYWADSAIDEKTGLRKTPEKVADYKELAAEISRKLGVHVRYFKTDLLDGRGLMALKGIGASYLPTGQRPIPFAAVALHVAPLVPGKTDSRAMPPLVQNQDSPILYAGSRTNPCPTYVFRVATVEPARGARSLSEVRDRVIDDIKLDRAYVKAEQLAKEILPLAETTKLMDLAKSANAKELLAKTKKEAKVDEFSRRNIGYMGQIMGPFIDGVSMNGGEFADECFKAMWAQPTTQPSGKFTTTLIADKVGRTQYIVQFVEKVAAEQTTYDNMRPMLMNFLQQQSRNAVYQQWFDSKSIHARVQFVDEMGEDKDAVQE